MAYQPFLISDYRFALQENAEPFLLPEKAFEDLQNAYVRNGAVVKRNGYNEFGKAPRIAANISNTSQADPCQVTSLLAHGLTTGDSILLSGISGMNELNGNEYTVTVLDPNNFTLDGVDSSLFSAYISGGVVSNFSTNPIMGLLRFINELGVEELVCLTSRRASLYSDTFEAFIPIDSFSEILGRGDGATLLYNGTLVFKPILAGSFSVTDGLETFTDDGLGVLTGNLGGSGTINYVSGAYSITFNANVLDEAAITSTYTCQEDLFTGDNTEFFQSVNYNGVLWMTNGEDRILTWNGTVLEPHIFDLTNQLRTTNEVDTCKFMKVLKERLILFFTTEFSIKNPQRVRWSQAGNTDVWQDTVAGRGGSLDVATGQWFQNVGFVREDLVLFFQRSSFLMRYTGNPDLPFTITKLNSSRPVDAPYSIVESDLGVMTIGKKSIIASDGTNVQDVDSLIPDYTLSMNQARIKQSFGFYHGENDQIWFLYPSAATLDENIVKSDEVLVFNLRDNNWSYYHMPMSCLGYYKVGGSQGFADFPNETFETFADLRWDSFLFIADAPLLLGGGHDGVIFKLDFENSDNGVPIDVVMKTKRFNVFEIGKNARLGKVDLLLNITKDKEITVNFYANFEEEPYLSKTVTIDTEKGKFWRSIYANRVGNNHQIEILSSTNDSELNLYAMRLWLMPVGVERGI
jgi:hypothetical protein